MDGFYSATRQHNAAAHLAYFCTGAYSTNYAMVRRLFRGSLIRGADYGRSFQSARVFVDSGSNTFKQQALRLVAYMGNTGQIRPFPAASNR